MKYSFMTFSTPELSWADVLALARSYGYDGVEPRAESGHRHGVELTASANVRIDIAKTAQEAGIAICCVATSCRFADRSLARENIQKTHEYIDLAADIGSPRVRVFGGKIGEGLSRDQAIDLLAESLASMADHAEERGVSVCVETHDDWCDPNHIARVMQKVQKPAIRVNWDVMHPVRAGGASIEQAHAILQGRISHVHFHDGTADSGILKPIGQGIIDHRAAVRVLVESGYDGYLSGEWIDWEIPYSVHLRQELQTMKQYEKELSHLSH